jgi:coenzyme PQQ biosynthesis protein PqqD
MAADMNTVLRLPRGVKFRFDQARDRWVLLGPERVFEPDEIAVEILQRVDGVRTLATITGELAAEFNAPVEEIGRDVIEFVERLMRSRMLDTVKVVP